MDDPVQRHPTRGEQLDILATLAADHAGGRVLELGVGKGYVAHLILAKNPDVRFTGIDRNEAALDEARSHLGATATLIAGDLEAIDRLDVPGEPFDVIYTALTFHDLPDPAKRAVIGWAATHLAPGGVFLLYDRLRLDAPALFPLQQRIWARIEREYGAAMRSADSYAAYIDDLGTDNRPGRLADYVDWFGAAELVLQVLHLHGNVALIGGAKTD